MGSAGGLELILDANTPTQVHVDVPAATGRDVRVLVADVDGDLSD